MNSLSTAAGFHLGSSIPLSDPDPTRHHHRHFVHSMPPPPPHPPPNPINLSDDDEDDAAKTKKGSPWHRVKWDDTMVSLLISIVGLLETDGASEAATPQRRPIGALQKKGKWKAASKLMLDKGSYSVSPQQCEDKFNDLNKRYKRLNEILGRGTTCQVVENPALLDAMPHIPPKAKDDVRKILASKHLFYREMCAYHNRPRATAPSASHEHEFHDHDTSNFDDSDEDEDEGNAGFGGRAYGSLLAEMDVVFHDKAKSLVEKVDWLHELQLKIQEERVAIEVEALDLEKERLRWQKYRSNKDREMERTRLQNERLMLENGRLAIQMKIKMREAELEHKRPGESMESTGGFRFDRDQRRDHVDLI